MSQQILQVNFNFNISVQEYKEVVASLAQEFAAVPGCQWKIWLMDEDKREAGGIYLFENKEALEHFKQTPLIASVFSSPALSNFSVKEFSILDEVSIITRAPLALEAEMH